MNKIKKIKVKINRIDSDKKAIEAVYNRIFSKVVENIKSKEKDQGTKDVAAEFHDEIKRTQANIQTVVIVAHRHHVERCRLILENDFNLKGLPYKGGYDKYDPSEAQPRVINSSHCIVSDFVSMAAMNRRFP